MSSVLQTHRLAHRTYFLLLALVAGAGLLSGCAGGAPAASATEQYTDSDEPEARKRATTRLRLAVLYFQDGKYSFALDETKQAIAADPTWFEGYNMRGLVLMRTNDLAQAEASFQKALSINSGSADLRHNYGVVLCKQGRHAEGLRMFASALAMPGYTRVSNTTVEQGVCQLAAGQRTDAEKSFLRAFELEPSNPAVAYNLGLMRYQQGDLPRAQFYLRRANQGELGNAESLWLGIRVERRLDARDAVSQLAAQLRKRFPQSREALAYERGAFDE